MPTAARLVAALCLAALAFFTSETIKTLMPASTDFGAFTYVNTALGALAGWVTLGSRAGRGISAAISNGLTGTATMVLWCLFVHACNEMVARSMRRVYDGAMEALVAIFEIGLEFGVYLVNLQVIVILLVGAVLSGWFTEIAARRWR